jgi:hypothetical protein
MIRKAARQVGAPALLAFMAWNAYLAVNHLKQMQRIAALTPYRPRPDDGELYLHRNRLRLCVHHVARAYQGGAAAQTMRITADDVKEVGCIDGIVPERRRPSRR